VIPPAVIAGGSRTVALDPYAAAVTDLPGLVAYWRLGDAGTAVLADASGHGHDGTYPAAPAAFGAARLTWDVADDRAVNFGGAGFGQVAHASAFVLPRGSLSFYFKATSLAAHQTLVQKGSGFVLEARSDGHLRLTMGSEVFETQNYAVAPIAAGTEYHVMVAWGAKRVRLYLDGRQVAWGMKHQAGLTGTSPWQLARSAGGTNANVVLDEVALWNRELSRAEMDALSECIRGLPYGQAESSEVVSTSDGLETAVNNAGPGHHILVADGTYELGTRTFSASGAKRRPIVIRPQHTRGDVTFTEPAITMSGSWLVIADIFMTNAAIIPLGHRNRVTRCRFRDISRYAVNDIEGDHLRVDHCDFSDFRSGSSSSKGGMRSPTSRLNAGQSKAALYDHNYFHDIIHGDSGGAQEMIAVGTTGTSIDKYPSITIERTLFDNLDIAGEGEIITLKANDCLVDGCTFHDTPGMYLSFRQSFHAQLTSSWFENMSGSSGGLNFFGKWNYGAGNHFQGVTPRIAPAGTNTTDDSIAGNGVGGIYANADGAELIGNTASGTGSGFAIGTLFSNQTINEAAKDTRMEANTGSITLGTETGTSQVETSDEPFTAPVKLTPSDAGMAAADPLVPAGYW
jgi:hypothetical protein